MGPLACSSTKGLAPRSQLRAALAAALVFLLPACVPAPGGQCSDDSDCSFGLTCQDSLCRKRPPRACLPACGAGFHCDDGTCGLDTAPQVTWLSPDEGALVAGGVIAVSLQVSTPARDASVALVVEPAQPQAAVLPVVITLLDGGDGIFRGLLDAGALDERDWNLRPAIRAASANWTGPLRRLRVDRTGPVVSLSLPKPAGAWFLRTDVIEVRAHAIDRGAGVDPASLAVVGEGMAPIAGVRIGPSDWSFQVPLAAPTFHAAEGPLLLGVRARDRLGNQTVQSGAVPVTRLLWRHDVGSGLPLRSSPVLDGRRVYVGTDSAKLVAIDRQTATPLWARPLNRAPRPPRPHRPRRSKSET